MARNVDDAVGVSRRKPCCIMELMVLETLSLAVSRKLDSATDTRQNSVEFIFDVEDSHLFGRYSRTLNSFSILFFSLENSRNS